MERARKVYGLPSNPVREVEKLRERYDATQFEFYSPEEVWALVRAAASEQDGALFLTAAFTGLRRGELIALRWRDVDFERSAIRVSGSYANGRLTTPKSGHGRVVPMVPEVATALSRLGRREWFVGEDDLVFPGEPGTYLDGSALRRRFVAACARAGLRAIRFHDLRHSCRPGSGTPRCGRRCATRTTASRRTPRSVSRGRFGLRTPPPPRSTKRRRRD